MINNSSNKKSHIICSQCGSELILISQEKVQPEGTRYPQINTVYRCSNEECQQKKDKEKTDRLKQKEDRLAIDEKRAKRIQEAKEINKKSKISLN